MGYADKRRVFASVLRGGEAERESEPMKVVLFCGGRGLRLIGEAGSVPKPMTPIGYRPLLWHIMKYYAHFGHTDFILCLGHLAHVIKEYFLDYREHLTNDFTLSSGGAGGANLQLLGEDLSTWNITFIDTGFSASVGERLSAVRPHLEGEPYFLANYADGVSDLDLNRYIDFARRGGTVANFVSVQPRHTYHTTTLDSDGLVREVRPVSESDTWINAGFFVFRQEIFEHLRPGEDLVGAPFKRLVAARQLRAYRHNGFWRGMDTFADHQELEQLYTTGEAPWAVWQPDPARELRPAIAS